MSHPWEANWILGDRLGKGGQGLTYLTKRINDSSVQAAIKVLKNNKDVQARRRMHREVASLEVLSSAGGAVPSVFDHNTRLYEDPSVELFVVMEYIPGPTLRELIESDGPLALMTATAVAVRICDTIELAHTHPILHRDLKPENVIARSLEDADIVIVDYGLSFNSEDPDVTVAEDTFRNRFLDLPETNTPGGNRRDPRSDITAACAIYYYLLTGHVPGQLQGGDGKPPHLRTGYSLQESLIEKNRISQLEVLFNRGFNPNMEMRFQTIGEFRDRVRLITDSPDSTSVEDPVVLASRASAVLRQRDRTTQLRAFHPVAMKVINSLEKYAIQYQNKLDRFRLTVNRHAHTRGKLPTGLDEILGAQTTLEITPEHHQHARKVVFAIASRGEQCVILRQRYSRKEKKAPPDEELQEIQWYDAETEPDLGPTETDITNWLSVAIQELVDQVIAQEAD